MSPGFLQDMQGRADSTQIRFLGTGCAEPSKYRSSSAVHVQLHNGYGVLLDAGEGAYGQMVQYYGECEAREQVLTEVLEVACMSRRVAS